MADAADEASQRLDELVGVSLLTWWIGLNPDKGGIAIMVDKIDAGKIVLLFLSPTL